MSVQSLVQHIDLSDLPEDWASPTMTASVQASGDAWVAESSSVILQISSASLLGEYNYLLNPAHPDAREVTFGSASLFQYEPRLLKA